MEVFGYQNCVLGVSITEPSVIEVLLYLINEPCPEVDRKHTSMLYTFVETVRKKLVRFIKKYSIDPKTDCVILLYVTQRQLLKYVNRQIV